MSHVEFSPAPFGRPVTRLIECSRSAAAAIAPSNANVSAARADRRIGKSTAEWQKTERAIRGRLAKLGGVESGVCDWFLSVPSGRWHGYYIEFKKPGAVVEPGSEQEQFIGYATARGYRCEVHTDAGEAWGSVLKYLQ